MTAPYSRNNLYLDRYFPASEPMPEATAGQSDPSPSPDYENFDPEWNEDLEMAPEEPADLEEESGLGEEIPEEPTKKQQKLIDWLEDHGEDLQGCYEETQTRLNELLDGVEELKPEKKLEKLREVEAELAAIEDELSTYEKKTESLSRTGLSENDLLLDNPIDAEDLKDELEETQAALTKEIAAAQEAKVEAETKEAKAKAEEIENKTVKANFLDALGYLNGAKGEVYFTAKVWGDKHIKDYHEDVSENARRLISQMADAVVSGDWDTGVKTTLDSLNSGAADNTLALVFVCLDKQGSGLLEKIPSEILEAMSDAIKRGNDPGDKNIYFITQDGKYDGPKDDRRRKDMHHFDLSYADAADRFAAQAEINRQREMSEAETAEDAEDTNREDADSEAEAV